MHKILIYDIISIGENMINKGTYISKDALISISREVCLDFELDPEIFIEAINHFTDVDEEKSDKIKIFFKKKYERLDKEYQSIIHEILTNQKTISDLLKKFFSSDRNIIVLCLIIINNYINVFDVTKKYLIGKLYDLKNFESGKKFEALSDAEKRSVSKPYERAINGETPNRKYISEILQYIYGSTVDDERYYYYDGLDSETFTSVLNKTCKALKLTVNNIMEKYKEKYNGTYNLKKQLKYKKKKEEIEVYVIPRIIQYRILHILYEELWGKCRHKGRWRTSTLELIDLLELIDDIAFHNIDFWTDSFDAVANWLLYDHICNLPDEKLYLISNHAGIVFYLTKFADEIREYQKKDELEKKIKELKEKFKGKDVNTPLNMSNGLVEVQKFTQALKSKKKPLSDRKELLSMLREKLDENRWPIFPNPFDYTEEDERIFDKFIKDLDFIISLSDEKELEILERLYIDRHEYCYKEIVS